MESFSNDIHAILRELNQSEHQADEIISSFQKGFDDVVQKYAISKNTPIKPSKKKAKSRVEKVDSHEDSFSSTNSSRSTTTLTRSTTLNGHQSADDEPLIRPVRTGRVKAAPCYKEPPLNTKMRRDGGGTLSVANVKIERTSTEKPKSATPDPEPEPSVRPVRIKKEKVDEPIVDKSAAESDSNKKTSNDVLSDSLEIVPMETNPTIELSDDENVPANGNENRTGNDGNKMPPPAFVPPVKATKEKKAPVEKKIRSTRSKQPKRKIKQEPASESEDETAPIEKASASESARESARETASINSESKSTRSTRNAAEKSKNRPINTSGESLYEDAVSQPENQAASNKQIASQQCDATFVTTVDETDKDQLSPRGTYVIPKGAAVVDSTFDVEKSAGKTKQINNQTVVVTSKVSASSLMTEDDSDSDTGVRKYALNGIKSKKDPKELFNPCTSKPIKQRVEAFEKLQTPQKETRTRAKGLLNSDSEKAQKVTHGSLLSKYRPSEQSSKHIRTTSATRYAQSNQKPTLPKSQSVEEIRKKAQAVVDEKKKKQDDKLKKAQQMREAQEKEKADKARKLLLEKEQRAKEKAQQKQQEEQLRMAEQKRREEEREKKRKEAMMAKKAAADRKEQEHYLRVLAEKKAMQEQLRQNKMKAEESRKKNAYNFDMLESGDSTDDEGKTSSKRPMPPAWSMSHNRHAAVIAQSKVSTKITDKFFSVAPHEVDLREIFPRIDEKYLRRNSSAVWNSPPRYSLLPKY